MPRPLYILAHALAGGTFMYFLQTLVWSMPMETGLLWGVLFGLGAAGLAWHQSNR